MGQRLTGEEALHQIFLSAFRKRKDLPVGPGADCARLLPVPGCGLVVTCDQVIEGLHAARGTSPLLLGRKLVGRTLSDLAAAGARPWVLFWTAAVPRTRSSAWVRRLARGFLAEAARFQVPVAGGDLSHAGTVVLTCTAIGREGRRPMPGRHGARPGDRLCVTGRLGNAVKSGRHLCPRPRLEEGRRLVERFHAHAMMDLSDGMAADLPRLLRASGVGARIDLDALPLAPGVEPGIRGWRAALEEGEDYELLAALSEPQTRKAGRDPVLRRTGLTPVGEVLAAGQGVRWMDRDREWSFGGGWRCGWNARAGS
ncbi:MAG: thiamine-monophosphate kinase [Planctomycetota bacterium]